MILQDLSDLIIFDDLPLYYDENQKIILTHLLHIDKRKMPVELCVIYTTATIARRFKKYCKLIGYEGLREDRFVYVEPYTDTYVVVDENRTLKMLFCESDNLSDNLMVLIKEDEKLTHIYAGNFTDIRTVVLNETFATWTDHVPVQNLYLNLKRCDEYDDQTIDDVEQIELVKENVQKILLHYMIPRVNIYIPLLGYEYFISELVKRFNNMRVALSSEFKLLFNAESDVMKNSCDFADNPKIALLRGAPVSQKVRENYRLRQQITINMPRDNVSDELDLYPGYYYFELKYFPEPSPFDLQLLCSLIRPKRIFGIVDKWNTRSDVPEYLKEFIDKRSDSTTRRSK